MCEKGLRTCLLSRPSRLIYRGVGRCLILDRHTFSQIQGLPKILRGHGYLFLKILGGARAPVPPVSYVPEIGEGSQGGFAKCDCGSIEAWTFCAPAHGKEHLMIVM